MHSSNTTSTSFGIFKCKSHRNPLQYAVTSQHAAFLSSVYSSVYFLYASVIILLIFFPVVLNLMQMHNFHNAQMS